MKFKPGDRVRIKRTSQTATVTYGGPRAIPGRVYILRDSGITTHHYEQELVLVEERS